MITVLSPGAYTLVQDRGRGGHEHLGVPTSGAFDPVLFDLANTLLGNPDGSPALEVTATGPTLRFAGATQVSLAGQFLNAHLDGVPVPAFHSITVGAGSTLTVGSLTGALRGYVAISGGIDAPRTLGSAATCTLSGLGPARLSAGDTLMLSPGCGSGTRRAALTPESRAASVRVLAGPHAHLFSSAALDALTGTVWRVSPDSSRVGVRLDGPAVTAPRASLPSLGMVTGAVQVPPSGLPIVLGPDHGSTGGYPVPFVVVSADLSRLAQAAPGAPLRLSPVAHAPAVTPSRVWDLAALSA